MQIFTKQQRKQKKEKKSVKSFNCSINYGKKLNQSGFSSAQKTTIKILTNRVAHLIIKLTTIN